VHTSGEATTFESSQVAAHRLARDAEVAGSIEDADTPVLLEALRQRCSSF
jgi:hypothetical protein